MGLIAIQIDFDFAADFRQNRGLRRSWNHVGRSGGSEGRVGMTRPTVSGSVWHSGESGWVLRVRLLVAALHLWSCFFTPRGALFNDLLLKQYYS